MSGIRSSSVEALHCDIDATSAPCSSRTYVFEISLSSPALHFPPCHRRSDSPMELRTRNPAYTPDPLSPRMSTSAPRVNDSGTGSTKAAESLACILCPSVACSHSPVFLLFRCYSPPSRYLEQKWAVLSRISFELLHSSSILRQSISFLVEASGENDHR